MRDLLLQCSGVTAIAAAVIHGVLGETRVFARATIEPARLRSLIRLVWQAGTVAWIGGGVLLIAAPWLASEPARHWIVVTMACVFAFCGAGQCLGDARPAFRLDGAERGRRASGGGVLTYCNGGSPLVRFLARSISVTAIRISARVLRSGASSIACFSGGP